MGYRPPGSSVHWILQARIHGVGCHALFQGIFLTQGSNPGLLHCRWILYQLSHQGSPRILEWIAYPFSRGLPDPGIELGFSCIAGGFFTSWATWEGPDTLIQRCGSAWCFNGGYMLLCLPNSIEHTALRVNPWRMAWQPTPASLPGKSPWTEEPGGATVHGVAKSHTQLSNWTTRTALRGGGVGGLWWKILMKREPVSLSVPAVYGSSVLAAQFCGDPKPVFQTSLLEKGSRSYDYSSFAIIHFWKKVKSLSRLPTLCNLVDCSPPGSSVQGILQARNTGVGSHALLQGIFQTQGLNVDSVSLGPWKQSWRD